MALQAPPGLRGISTNMAATVPAEINKALFAGAPQPAGFSADEKRAWDQLDLFYKKGLAKRRRMTLRPQTLYGIADSPVGLAVWEQPKLFVEDLRRGFRPLRGAQQASLQ